MQLVNGEMTLLGPGSEWFWSAVSGLLVAISFFGLWRQLRLQQAQAAREELSLVESEWTSERMMRHRLAVVTAYRDGTPFEEWPHYSAEAVANFWARLATLARSRHLDLGRLSTGSGRFATSSWSLLHDYLEWRPDSNPASLQELRWLVDEMVARSPQTVDVDRAVSPEVLGASAERLEFLIALEEQLRR